MTKSITIIQLYSDIMSTYGDKGNVLYLEYFLRHHGMAVATIYHHYGEPIPPADIYVFGGGQDAAQTLVGQDLQGPNGQRLQSYLTEAYCLAICGGYQLLGRYYLQTDATLVPGLGYLPIATTGSTERLVGPVVIERQFHGKIQTIVGFENHCGKTVILDDSPALGSVKTGGGNNGNDQTEGIIYARTIGTYLHGPLLPRNPHLAYWWLKDVISGLQGTQRPPLTSEKRAHLSYISAAPYMR